jgi:hypothetical protein
MTPAADARSPQIPGAIGERMADAMASRYRPHRSRASGGAETTTWVQIDLGGSPSIDAVKLYPSNGFKAAGDGFPVRFRIDCPDDAVTLEGIAAARVGLTGHFPQRWPFRSSQRTYSEEGWNPEPRAPCKTRKKMPLSVIWPSGTVALCTGFLLPVCGAP